MPDTEASIGYGTIFEMADEATPTVFVAMSEVFNLTPPSEEDDEVEATHFQSPDRTREYIAGLTTPGEMSFEMNLVPGSASDLAAQNARGKRNRGRITFPNGYRETFPVVRRSYEREVPLDDRMVSTVTFRQAGAKTIDAATLPVNGVLPSIAGIAQVGETLTLVPGVWAPFATFTYQWNNEGVAIPGATGETYVPVVGDVGDNITVTVTATNTGGSASATSAETLPVIAA